VAATIAGRFCNDRSGYLYAARRPGLALNFRGAMKVKREKTNYEVRKTGFYHINQTSGLCLNDSLF